VGEQRRIVEILEDHPPHIAANSLLDSVELAWRGCSILG
jgi:hypothetical protein